MIRPCRPLRRNDPRTGLDDGPTNRLATQDSGSPNPRHLSRKGHLFHARQTIMAAQPITNLALQTRPPRSAPSANHGTSPLPNCALTTPDPHRLTLWWSPVSFGLTEEGTRPVGLKEGQHLGDDQ